MAEVKAVTVEEKTWSGRSGPSHFAHIQYEYLFGSEYHMGSFKMDVESLEEGEAFIHGLRGRKVTVSVDPDNHSRSFLAEESLAEVQETIPDPPPPLDGHPSDNLVAFMAWPSCILALVGFLTSLAIHIAVLTGVRLLPDDALLFMHGGIFVVWFSMILVAGHLQKRRRLGRALLKNKWASSAAVFLIVYAIVNLLIATEGAEVTVRYSSGEIASDGQWRAFSGFWMLFYGLATVVLHATTSAFAEKSLGGPDL